jgi:hypothetical protein
MKGDNVELTDLWRPTTAEIVGERWLIAPGVAPIVQFLMSPILLASVAAAFAAYLAVGSPRSAVSTAPGRIENGHDPAYVAEPLFWPSVKIIDEPTPTSTA